MRLFVLASLISFSALAANWGDLETGKSQKLTQSFQLKQFERSGSLIDFSEGEVLILKERLTMPFPDVPLELYIFNYPNCPGSDMRTDMDIVAVKDSSPVVEVGVQLDSCLVNMLIESKNLSSKSIFE